MPFQSFESKADPSQGPIRVARLREWLGENGLDGFMVPRADEHQGEYVPPCAERLAWLTGFTGSAGVAIILAGSAHLFVDGRYTLQARHQTDQATFSVEDLVSTPPAKWLRTRKGAPLRLAIDPWLHTVKEVAALRTALEKDGGELVALDQNAVDAIWLDRPGRPLEPVTIHPIKRAGKLAKEKLKELAGMVAQADADAAVLTDPASIAWSFNIRGSDVPHTPLALGFAIIAVDGAHQLFMDKRKMSREVEAYLTQLCDIRPPSELDDALRALAAAGKRVGLDPQLAADQLRRLVEEHGGKVVAMSDPASLPRACKNDAELAGTRAAHRRDGAAVSRFLAWLDGQKPGTVTEMSAVEALETSRIAVGEETQEPLRDISFDTISGAGPNGAIMHYRVTTSTSRTLGADELYLVDSGGQYEDGTTDITRTVPIGSPTDEMRERYTIVLKGLIAISTIRFPPGTRGQDLDPLARVAHWKAGIDFAHGTGHGVGSYLSVHEGPQRISRLSGQELLASMIPSNEPGYYKEGEYGIRLENLVAVSPPSPIAGGEKPMHGIETLTLAPFDRRMIVAAMLTDEERAWLDAYHARVAAEITPFLEGPDRDWLARACAPLD